MAAAVLKYQIKKRICDSGKTLNFGEIYENKTRI